MAATANTESEKGDSYNLEGIQELQMQLCFIYTFQTPTKLTSANPDPNTNQIL